jgi:hypothetical protein
MEAIVALQKELKAAINKIKAIKIIVLEPPNA